MNELEYGQGLIIKVFIQSRSLLKKSFGSQSYFADFMTLLCLYKHGGKVIKADLSRLLELRQNGYSRSIFHRLAAKGLVEMIDEKRPVVIFGTHKTRTLNGYRITVLGRKTVDLIFRSATKDTNSFKDRVKNVDQVLGNFG